MFLQILRFWSPMAGEEVIRVSIPGPDGREYFCHIPGEPVGRAYREAKDRAVQALLDAIDRGDEPGEVKV